MSEKVTVFTRAHVRSQPSALGKGRIISVIVQNTFNNMDNTSNNSEIMVGDAVNQPHQLIPGEKSEEIFAYDLEDVWVRVRDVAEGEGFTDGTPVDVTLIIHKEKEL